MDVSENSGFPPKSSILIGFSIIFTIHFRVPLFLWNTPFRTSGTGMSIHPPPVACPGVSQATVLRDIYGNQTLISGATGATVTRLASQKNELLICFKIDTSLQDSPPKNPAISRVHL